MSHDSKVILKEQIIAVVDDDAAVRNSLAFAFQNEGFLIQAYESAEELLRDPSRDLVNCFIIDHKLPGLSGLELLSELRSGLLTAPVVLITTSPGADLRRRAAAEGAAIVEKPLLGDVLFKYVQAALTEAIAQRSIPAKSAGDR